MSLPVLSSMLAGTSSAGQTPTPANPSVTVDQLAQALEIVLTKLQSLEKAVPPVGSIIAWHKSALFGVEKLPAGWEECDGQQKIINGRTYQLPNLNSGGSGGTGLFIRGGVTSGVTQDSSFASHSHGGSTGLTQPMVTDASGLQMQRVQMYHQSPAGIDTHRASFAGGSHGFHTNVVAANHSHLIPTEGGPETRPANMSMVWIMRIF